MRKGRCVLSDETEEEFLNGSNEIRAILLLQTLPGVKTLKFKLRRHIMFLLIALLLILFWGGGLFFHVAGGLIHILLVLAVISIIWHFIAGRRAV